MTKLGAIFWIGLVLASGFTTFKVKYAVQEIDDELTRVRKQAIAEQQEIRVLAAEWSYLNQPERLAELNRVLLQLAPLTARQLQQRIEDIAWRAPPAAPGTLVAANQPASHPSASPPSADATPSAASLSTMPPAAALPSAMPAGEMSPDAAGALAAAVTVLGAGTAVPAPQLRLAKAAPGSLDALIARIADTR